jgi:hypothetical protein
LYQLINYVYYLVSKVRPFLVNKTYSAKSQRVLKRATNFAKEAFGTAALVDCDEIRVTVQFALIALAGNV